MRVLYKHLKTCDDCPFISENDISNDLFFNWCKLLTEEDTNDMRLDIDEDFAPNCPMPDESTI